ncbi:hypothetical protein Y032_0278g1169 [Ancylostoma ceylanicum]|uniref:SCP domain-containing protein n=1 Tax=Ancylostoma ceylanicum TaxID=53326 RepID=A0A016S784_9BILA|nr:hypothetical protein Y032_0278g1169 [Ancylostoma ceylanicum]
MAAIQSVSLILFALFGALKGQVNPAPGGNGSATNAPPTTTGSPAASPGGSTAATAASTAATPAPTTTVSTRKPWPKPNCGNPSLTNAMRDIFLNYHNDKRGSLARGQTEASYGWGIAPPATIMYRMKYDCNAESYAQQAVNTCRRTELPAHATGGHKQNLFILNSPHVSPNEAIRYVRRFRKGNICSVTERNFQGSFTMVESASKIWHAI